jgi:hypothetical protein
VPVAGADDEQHLLGVVSGAMILSAIANRSDRDSCA